MADERKAPDAAMKLAEYMLQMRIEIRAVAYEMSGAVKDRRWDEAYRLMREYEDAETQDMINGMRVKPPRNKKQRRRDKKRKQIRIATDDVVVEKKHNGQHSENHPWRAKPTRKT